MKMPYKPDREPRGAPHSTRTNILVQMGASAPSLAAMKTALELARAFSSNVEGLFVEDEQVLTAARFSFTQEITSTSGRCRSVAATRLAREMKVQAQALCQRSQALAKAFEVPLHTNIVRDEIENALYQASLHARYLVLSQTKVIDAGSTLFRLINRLPHVEGFLLVGAKARHRPGPIILAIDDHTDKRQIEIAAQLANSTGKELILMPIDPDMNFLHTARTIRTSLVEQGLKIQILPALGKQVQQAAHIVKRLAVSLLILPIECPLTNTGMRLGRLTSALGTPLLLLRRILN